MAAGKAGVERVHRKHLATLGIGGGCGQRAGCGRLIKGIEAFLVELGEGAVGFADSFLVFPDLVDGEAQCDNFHGH